MLGVYIWSGCCFENSIYALISKFFFIQVIVRQSVDKAEFQDSSVEKILNLLFNHCESEEEGVRNVVAECLGKIALIEPAKLVPALKVPDYKKKKWLFYSILL